MSKGTTSSPRPSYHRVQRNYARGQTRTWGVILHCLWHAHQLGQSSAADALESLCHCSHLLELLASTMVHRKSRRGRGLSYDYAKSTFKRLLKEDDYIRCKKTGWSALGKSTRHSLTLRRSHQLSMPLLFFTYLTLNHRPWAQTQAFSFQ